MRLHSFVLNCTLPVALAVTSLQTRTAHGVAYWEPDNAIVEEEAPFYEPADLLHPLRTTAVKVQVPGWVGSGSLIAPNWIVSAAHVINHAFDPGANPLSSRFYINSVEYKVDSVDGVPIMFPHPSNGGPTNEYDVGIARIVQLDGNDANLDADWTPIGLAPPVAAMTFGGYGPRETINVESGVSTEVTPLGQQLFWGRNVFTAESTGLRAAMDRPETSDYIKYEASARPGDSGSGIFFKEGWEWQVGGLITHEVSGSKFSNPTILNWIYDIISDYDPLPSRPSTPIPTADTEWIGATTTSWSQASNWSNGLPTSTSEIRVNNNPHISSAATAKNIFVGVDGDPQELTNGSMRLQAGGTLTVADTLYLSPESDDVATFNHDSGSVSATREYIGHRGKANYQQKSGTNTASEAVYVGYQGGTAIDPSLYTLSSSGGGDGSLVTKALIIGGGADGYGKLQISANGSQSVHAKYLAVGGFGTGTFIQNGGEVTAEEMILGWEQSGVGKYELNAGTLTTTETTVGYQGSGEFVHNEGIHSTESLYIDGNSSYDLNGGELEIKGASFGVIDLNGTSARVKTGPGIINLAGLDFNGHQNGEFETSNDSLVLLADSDDLFSNLVNLNTLPPHIVGNNLAISQHGFHGTGTISDPVQLSGTGYIVALEFGLSLTGGLELAGTSAVEFAVAQINQFLISGDGMSVSGGSPTFDGNGGTIRILSQSGAVIDGDATLITRGKYVVTDEGETELMEFLVESNGALEVGPDVATLSIEGKLVLDANSQLIMDVNDQEVDLLELTGAGAETLPELDGTLVLDVPSDGVPDKWQYHVLTTLSGFGSQIPQFAKVSVSEDGSPTGGIIITNTTSEATDFNVAMAVLYPDDFETFGIDDLTSQECPDDKCIVVQSVLPGDFDANGEVDGNDLLHFLGSYDPFHEAGPWTYADGDLNGDTYVDGNDFLVFLQYNNTSWGSGGGGGVPEPHSIVSLLTSLAAFAIATRKHRVSD